MASSAGPLNNSHFPFMKLPPEVRCMIYKDVFSTPVLYVGYASGDPDDSGGNELFLVYNKVSYAQHEYRQNYSEEQAILVTCKDVRKEALPFYDDSLQLSLVDSAFNNTNGIPLQDALELLRPVQIVHYSESLYASVNFESLPNLKEVRMSFNCNGSSPSMPMAARSRAQLKRDTCNEARYFFNEFTRRHSDYLPLLRQFDQLDWSTKSLTNTDRQLPYKISICLDGPYVNAWQRSWDYVVVDLEAKRIVRSSPTDAF